MGNRIREARKNAKLTQAELAKQIGVTQGAVTQWEIGRSAPKLQTMLALARALNVSVDYLIGDGGQTDGASIRCG